MKSWAIVFFSDLALWVRLFFFWLLALPFAIIAWKLSRKRKWVAAAPFALAMAALMFVPFWSRTAGRQLAQELCDEIGGPHEFTALPARGDSISYEGVRAPGPFLLSDLLQEEGYEFVEHVDEGGQLRAWRIEPASSGRCSNDWMDGFWPAFNYAWFHEHGMRADECLTHDARPASTAALRYSLEKEVRRKPVPVEITHHRFVTGAGKPVWTHSGFTYYPVNPYSTGGAKQAVACHPVAPMQPFADRKEIVASSRAPRRWPGLPIRPTLVSTEDPTQLLSLQRVEPELIQLDDALAMRYYRTAMDLRDGGPQVWRPFYFDRDGATRISWGNGLEATTVDVPAFAGARRQGEVKMRAAKLQDGHLFVVREHDSTWEVSDFDIDARTWRRNYVLIHGNDFPWPPGWTYRALNAHISALDVEPGKIVLRGVSIRSTYSLPTPIDNGFRLEFRRP